MQGRTSAPARGSGKKYRSYRCASATRARALCTTLNGHSTRRLDKAVLAALAKYTDPKLVADMLADAAKQASRTGQADERKRFEAELKALDDDFAENLALLKKGVLDEAEFTRANAGRRTDRAALEKRIGELVAKERRADSHDKVVAELPGRIRGFIDGFEEMDARAAKGQLQTILSAIHVWNDNRVELELRLD
jgi:hypothetical protein